MSDRVQDAMNAATAAYEAVLVENERLLADAERSEKHRNNLFDRVVSLRTDVAALRAENERLKSFARRIIGTSAFEGHDLDGSYVQMIAENRELITRCKYDPERHGPSEYAEPGDDFYEFAPILCGPALSEAQP